MRRRALDAALLLCLLLSVIAFQCGKSPSPVTTNMGGSEVVGKLVTAANIPMANARIFAYRIPSDASAFDSGSPRAASLPAPADTVFSNENGEYKFTNLTIGYYQLFASGKYGNDSLFASHDKVYNDYLAPASEPTHKIDIGIDTMKAPGAIRGKVVFEPGYSNPVTCYIPGSSYISITDNNGDFLISDIPVGTYRFGYSGGGYATATDSNIVVLADSTTILPPKILQLSTQGGPPAPVGIHAVYDTANGKVVLSWNKVNVSDLQEYIIFRKEQAQDSFAQIGISAQPETSYVDYVYKDPLDSSSHVYFYELYSKDIGGELGSHSEFCSVSVVSPALVGTLLIMHAGITTPDTIAVYDNEAIVCNYVNQHVIVDSLVWSMGKPDSIIRKSKPGTKNGSDTLRCSWNKPGIKTIYCTVQDASGKRWNDSIIVVVIQDAPVVRYLSPDTTVEFNGMVRCSLDVEHRFGACTLFVDLDHDKIFEIKRLGLSFDTLFNTNTDLKGGKIRIKIADSHRNVVDTFFTLTIGSTPLHDHWEEADSMPTSRKLFSVCVINKTLYAIGGCKRFYNGTYNPKPVNTLEAYSSAWSTKDTMKTARYSFVCGENNGCIYVCGGIGTKGYTKSVERYDTAANKWSSIGNMPFFRASAASCVYNQKLYLFGGRMPYQTDVDSVGNDIHVYDFASNQWTNVTGHMNSSRHDFQAVVSGNKIYLIGGMGGSTYSTEDEVLTSCEIFDPSASQCALGPSLDSYRAYFAAASINDSIFIIGGIDDKSNLINTISVLNPTESVWREKTVFPAPYPQGRLGCGAGVINGKIAIVGGGTDLSIDNPGFADGIMRIYTP